MLDRDSLHLLDEAVELLDQGFAGLPPFSEPTATAATRSALLELAGRLQDNYPYGHPLYAGQMLKPPHPAARLAYALAMYVNPNNHALDGGRATSAMEKEAVREIASMFGWADALGHLCGGGTLANLEALWVSGRLTDGARVLASAHAHYTHERMCGVLGMPFVPVEAAPDGRLDAARLEKELGRGPVGVVVVTMGTTGLGAVDPLRRVLDLRDRYGFRVHCDAAYGGYFRLCGNLDRETSAEFEAMSAADSIVIDPHKHGLQPYGCGCVLFRDPTVGRLYKHDSPYTYFSSDELHLGEISLECSRAGASAAALWTTQRVLPLVRGGEFAQGLEASRTAALKLYEFLQSHACCQPVVCPELDIVVWAVKGESASEMSRRARAVFAAAAALNLHLALITLPISALPGSGAAVCDKEAVTCLRSVLMKPEHLAWVEEITEIVARVLETVCDSS